MRFCLSCDEDPGDPGTQAGGINERDQNVRVCNFLQVALHRCGQTVSFDDQITHMVRVAQANADGTDVLVACAHNASDDPDARGTVFVFCNADAHTFGKQAAAATECGDALVTAGISTEWTTYDEPVDECCLFNRDTVFCEVLFQTNADDLAMITSPGYHARAAEALCAGLAATYGFAYVAPPPIITPVAFTARAAKVPLGFYDGPTTGSRLLYNSRAKRGEVLFFDAWTYGEIVTDVALGTPDARWYRRTKTGTGWTASAWVDGNAPGSAPLPPD